MQKAEYVIGLTPDRSAARIETHVAGEMTAWSLTSPEELSEIIASFIRARADMTDEVPTDLDPNAAITALVNPFWKITPGPDRDGVVLAIRHPGAGWMGFYLPSASAQRLKQILNEAL
ncbi:hypothetical protein [Mesorhizobium sp. Pch-S]|uniref:hypothetical protein n=1 Tax=Mesorhizobium sp. Pch-S TaxID=2082387 RepID=UPI0010108515|nr:hypothetical protein [Mesorhizobium sp. Pch-S]QAZ45942.1 hypothetical protein C1M53_26525 [Mesorhizobium sp. Pch-S]